MARPRRSGLGVDPLADLTGTTPEARPRGDEAVQPAALPRSKRWRRVMVYLDPDTDGRWLNEVMGKAKAAGLTQRDMSETELVRAGLAELQRLSWDDLKDRVARRRMAE